MTFVRPFRFGGVTVNAAPQAFVHVELEVEGRGVHVGASAEMMVPKWFDKRPHLSIAQTVDELRESLSIAAELYRAQSGFISAFGLHAACIGQQMQVCAGRDIPPLAAAFGPAEIDKAVLDALLRGLGMDLFTGMAANVAGLTAQLAPDLDDEAIATFLNGRQRLARVALRHTVGLDDQIEGEGGLADIGEIGGARYFKLKLGGDPIADAMRLQRIGKALTTLPGDYHVTLDANEQYADLHALGALVDRLDHDSALAPIATKLLYIEQPMPRDITRQTSLGELSSRNFIIDEADDAWDAFPAARALGYRGISSKSCKGLYKSIVNATRAAAWSAQGAHFFITAEDLTCQAGLGVQQDLALGALIGTTHAERNGHHYVDGFADAPPAEAAAFLAAHPDLYRSDGNVVRLRVNNGDLATDSLTTAGFASGAHPDWAALSPLDIPNTKVLQES